MDQSNRSVEEFILLAFSGFQKFQLLLFIVILQMFVLSIAGNAAIVTLVRAAATLHRPMYLFISVFAALEISFVSVTVPKLLAILIAAADRISFVDCFAQLYAFNALGVTECYMLAVMALDRDLAVNHPLRYSAIVTDIVSAILATLPFVISFAIALVPTVFTADLIYCGPNEIDHFFCDLAPVQSLACSDPTRSALATSAAAVFASLTPFVLILGFYAHIIVAVAKIKSAAGKRKAFSTCSAHLAVACLFYTSVVVVYVKPKGSRHDKFLALLYTVVVPFMNPFIYTFRNQDVKDAFRKILVFKFRDSRSEWRKGIVS